VSRIRFLTAAATDIETAFAWYEAQRPGLGHEFLRAVRAAVDSALAFPEACPVVHRETRRLLVERFPYCVFYHVKAEGVLVVACLHAARDPERRDRRLGS
jgi:plasmid stabilization system protein ParE